MVKTLLSAVALALGVLLLYAATRPDTFRVQRTASIQAPLDKVHPLISDMRAFNRWNPFNKMDPNMKGRYRGPAAGPGAGFDFEGEEVGKGSIEIVAPVTPTRVSMTLDMLEPMEGHNRVDFLLRPVGDTTEVTWAMHGPSPFLSKLVGVFVDMDRMVGGEFEAGLAELKAMAERR